MSLFQVLQLNLPPISTSFWLSVFTENWEFSKLGIYLRFIFSLSQPASFDKEHTHPHTASLAVVILYILVKSKAIKSLTWKFCHQLYLIFYWYSGYIAPPKFWMHLIKRQKWLTVSYYVLLEYLGSSGVTVSEFTFLSWFLSFLTCKI